MSVILILRGRVLRSSKPSVAKSGSWRIAWGICNPVSKQNSKTNRGGEAAKAEAAHTHNKCQQLRSRHAGRL